MPDTRDKVPQGKMAILKEGGHIPCLKVPEISEIDMTDAGTTETPPP